MRKNDKNTITLGRKTLKQVTLEEYKSLNRRRKIVQVTTPVVYELSASKDENILTTLEIYLDGSHHESAIRESGANAFMIGDKELGYSPATSGFERQLVGLYREDYLPVTFYKIKK